jgi:hypothetical protein
MFSWEVNLYRSYQGVKFKIAAYRPLKSDATRVADYYRHKGYLARIEKIQVRNIPVYGIFVSPFKTKRN